MIPFRKHHLINIVKDFSKKHTPLDIFLKNYFIKNKSIGSKDRKEISENMYKLIRWQSLIDHITEKPITLENKIDTLDNFDPSKFILDEKIDIHIRISFPKKYFEKLKNDFSLEEAKDFCLTSNETAPTTIRANLIKISRDDLFDILIKKFPVEKCKKSPYGINFYKKINFFETEEFKKGYFEIQDEASQLASDLIDIHPKDHILDYCAGSGGKSLSIAHKLKNTNQIYLHDSREYILEEAKKRLKRASVQNFQIKNSLDLKNLNQKMDVIIVDVPCSGSGTLRRNPDLKWRFDIDEFEKLLDLQKNIFHEAFQFLNKKGKIIYITCSIFKDENQDQIDYFTKKYDLKIIKTFSTFPEKKSHDGFFACVMQN